MGLRFSSEKYPNLNSGHKYANDIVTGKILASKYVIGACRRYLKDVEATGDKVSFYFDPEKAERFLRLVQRFEHVIGKWETPNIVYEPWQKFVWMNVIGFIDKRTSERRFRTAHLEVARGNAKSAMASQAALFFGFLDNPQGNQVATVATKKEQARIVLDSSRAMARKNKKFLKANGVRVLAHSITQESTNSVVRALSAEASGLDGLNDVLAVLDELHAMKRQIFEVITSGMSKRSDSLTLCITTAGFNVDSVGASQSAYAKKVCLGEVIDDQFFSAVYTLDDDDQWDDPKVWIKANPNWGVSVDPVTFEAKIEKAKTTPSDIPNIKVKHLNVWMQEANAFFDQRAWDACAKPGIKLEDYLNKTNYQGLDMASHIDIASIGYVFKEDDKYVVFDRSYIPEATAKDVRSVIYDEAIEQGFLTMTPGAAINFKKIEEQLAADSKAFRINDCMYDPWNAVEMAQNLSSKIEMVEFRMVTANLSEPMKKFDALIRSGKIVHNGSPLLRWTLGNVVAKRDHNDNVYPRKSHEKLKIDPIVAIMMALAGWLQNDTEESVYESRGIRIL